MAYNYDDQIPTWANEGAEPAESVKLEGYKPGYKPPASYFNWFWSRTLRWLNDLRTKLSSLHTQVQTVESKVKTLEDKDYDVSAESVLEKLKTVDGAESGLDADMLDGKHASAFADVNHSHTQYAPNSHTHALATETSNGFMSSEMFSKLKAFDIENLTTYTHPSTHPASMITGLHSVATSGNYADLINKPNLHAIALSGSYNDLKDKPSIYTHPSTHPASMITETDTLKFMTSDERIKLAGVEALANHYTHPSTHPASMITGLEAYIEGLGYGKVATGSYIGDGQGNMSYTDDGGTIHYCTSLLNAYTPSSVYRTITLPFTPSVLMFFDKTGNSQLFLYQNVELTTSKGSNYNCGYIALTGSELRVNNLGSTYASVNKAGYTYYWLIF